MEKDYIRLFSADLDIKPTLLIEHFLKYMGFCVEKIPFDNYNEETTAVYDIIVIGNDFEYNKYNLNKTQNSEKRTIYVGTDGYIIKSPLVFSVNYNSMKEEKFLFELVNKLKISFEYRPDDVNKIIKAYIDNSILEAYLFGKNYESFKIFNWSKEKYNNFYNNIPNNSSNLIKNIYLQIQIELSLIYKINKKKNIYNSSILLNDCEELLKSNKLYILQIAKGEILYRFQGKWLDGAETYLTVNTITSYLGAIDCLFEVREYKDIISILEYCIEINKKNYIVWYKLGLAYKGLGEYYDAIECFDKIQNILKDRFQNNFLSPLEKQYLYKSFLQQATIYKTVLSNQSCAYRLGEVAEQIHDNNNCMDNYIDLMLSDKSKKQGIDLAIKECVYEATKVKLKQIY